MPITHIVKRMEFHPYRVHKNGGYLHTRLACCFHFVNIDAVLAPWKIVDMEKQNKVNLKMNHADEGFLLDSPSIDEAETATASERNVSSGQAPTKGAKKRGRKSKRKDSTDTLRGAIKEEKKMEKSDDEVNLTKKKKSDPLTTQCSITINIVSTPNNHRIAINGKSPSEVIY